MPRKGRSKSGQLKHEKIVILDENGNITVQVIRIGGKHKRFAGRRKFHVPYEITQHRYNFDGFEY